MDYLALKHSHAGLAYLTVILFVLRFAMFHYWPRIKQNKILKVLPHMIDALLLVFALWMLFSPQFGLSHGWLVAKVIGLLVYISFGVVAIRQGKAWGFIAALGSYGYVLGVAKTKAALSWLVYFL